MPTLCSSRPRPRDRPSQHALIGYEGTYRRAQCEPACQIPRRSDRPGGGAAGSRGSGADAAAVGQVGRPGHPQAKERERPGTLYGRWRAEAAGRA
jgi:hypothetical protein